MDNINNSQFNMQNNQGQQFNNQMQNNGSSKFTFYLIMGILQLLCCNQITGIITIIFASIANTDFNKGDMISYKQRINACKWATIIGVALGIIIYAFVIFIYGVAIIAELASY